MNANRLAPAARHFLLPLAAALLALLLPAPLPAQESCTTAECHGALLARPTVHAAAEACDSCHTEVSTPHPQRGAKTFALTQEVPALCGDCHDAFGGKAHVHSPVADGMCTDCHDPHSSAQPRLLAVPLGELCAGCHGEQTAELPHGPVAAGDCTACHDPHESAEPALLAAAEDEVCFGCHVDLAGMAQSKGLHAAVDAGCSSCHDAHGTSRPDLLVEEGQALCFQCHDDVGAVVQQATVPHAPLQSAKGCASCHSPHASEQASLLLAPQREGCLGCHQGVVDRGMTTLHGPLRDGSCVACHQPHGAGHPSLLAAAFPAGPYAPYAEAEFALCFQCHDADLARFADTRFATGFRDGERNLHFVHVNDPQKGRSCKLCHAPHGADNPALIARSVPFGRWNLPLGFVETETGGSCAPGCHRPYGYDREHAVGGAPPAPARTQ